MEAETIPSQPKTHHGRNVRRIREIMGVKQETVADALGITQPAVCKLEQKEQIDEETLTKVAEVLKVPVDAIKNYKEESVLNIVANTFSSHDNSTSIGSPNNPMWYCTFNPLDNIVELYERIIELERQKNKQSK